MVVADVPTVKPAVNRTATRAGRSAPQGVGVIGAVLAGALLPAMLSAVTVNV
jgi:hypothetical protein